MIVEKIVTEIKLLPKYASTTATTTAIDADHGVLVDEKTSGKVMEVRTAHGMYARKDFRNLFLTLFFIKIIGDVFKNIITAHKTKTIHINFCVDITILPPVKYCFGYYFFRHFCHQ